MDRFLRIATPLILVALALLVWFETFLRNENASPWLGETGVLRFAVGVLCLYVLLVVVEQQRTNAAFKEVLEAFKRFHNGRNRGGEEPKREAITLLIGALSSGDQGSPGIAQSPEIPSTASISSTCFVSASTLS